MSFKYPDNSVYHAVFNASRDAIFLIEGDRFVDCNAAAVELFEAVEKETLLNARPSDFSPATQPDGRSSEELAEIRIKEAFRHGSALFEWTHRTLRGRKFVSEVQLSRVDTADEVLIQGIVRDISARRKTEEALQYTNRQLEHFRTLVVDAIDHAEIGLFILDEQFNIVWCSKSIREFTGLDPKQTMGQNKRELITQSISRLFTDGDRFIRNTHTAYQNGTRLEGRVYHVGPTDTLEERWLEHQSYPIMTGMYAGGRIEIYRDVTSRMELESKLSHRATHDYLTGLLNRQQFEILLDKEINRARRYGSPLCLVMFDVDRFKFINDNLGHDVGDEVLRKIAGESKQCIRDSDSLSRWGGEEFMLLLPDCSIAGAGRRAEELRHSIRTASLHDDLDRTTISLGVVCYREEENRRELLRRVDDALYAAKQRGRDCVVAAD